MTDTKLSNPKDTVGVAKVPLSTISAQVMGEVGVAMLEGARKYGRHNYRVAGVRASVYYDGAQRHLMAWFEGQDIDPGSGLSHITKAIAGLIVLRDAMLNEMWTDDRPPAVLNQDWVEDLSAMAGDIIAKYPDGKPPFTKLLPAAKAEALPERVTLAGWYGDARTALTRIYAYQRAFPDAAARSLTEVHDVLLRNAEAGYFFDPAFDPAFGSGIRHWRVGETLETAK